jgi:sugar phosphate isomerase/epimerase
MRVGATSYIHPGDILANVRLIAAEIKAVTDIELIIFESEEAGYPLPSEELRAELRSLSSTGGFTYTVHLPLDLQIADFENTASILKAIRVVEATKGLEPSGYVIHVEGGPSSATGARPQRIASACAALEVIGRVAGAIELLCVENIDVGDHGFLEEIVARIPVSRCVDVGHLWKAGLDPLPLLNAWLPRAKIVHLHGVGERDHLALSLVPSGLLTPVVSALQDAFSGVVTMEVFSEKDLRDSLAAYWEAQGLVGA